jgi:sterol desaturase/sphingolipid hydroxylase (fatty acid hydroxylase superfamily)
MGKIKLLAWWLGFVLVWALVFVATQHRQLPIFGAHRGWGLYLLVAVILAIPAKITVLGAAYLLELLQLGWSRSSLRMLWQPDASVRLDALSLLVMLLLPQRYLGYLLSFGLLYVIDVYTAHQTNFTLTRYLTTWVPQIACFVLFQSFLQYWKHRLQHAVPALWALHKFHHSADRLSILTSARQTQLTKGIESALVLLPAALLTDPTAALPGTRSPAFAFAVIYFGYNAFVQLNGYLVHSNLATDYGWIGRWLLVSPRMHRLHHAKSRAYHDKNFTFDLVLWDRLFGTYASCDTAADALATPLGLEKNPFHNSSRLTGLLREYFLTTYVVFWQELRKGFKAWLPRFS